MVHVPPSPLKDLYAFSVCLQLLGASPQTSTGALPLDPAGGLRPPDPMFCPRLSKFLATPLDTTTFTPAERQMLPLPRAENSSGPPWPLPGRDCLLSSMLNMQDLKGSVLSPPPPKKKLQNKPLFRIGKSFKAARLGFVGPPASHGVNHTAGSGWRHSASSDKNVTTVEQRLKQQSCLEWMSVCSQKKFYSVRCGFADVIAKCLRASTVFF